MKAALGRVRAAIDSKRPDEEWLKAQDRISSQRAMVDRHLSTTNRPHVYGFETFFGPLDSNRAPEESQLMLLKAHLQGRQGYIDGDTFAAITAVKLEQLSLGGTGVHPDTFRGVLKSMDLADSQYAGAWKDSYSSGDVVPASWWLKNILDHGRLPTLHQGDVIALINGNFVSTAMGVIALDSLTRYFAKFLAISACFVDPVPARLDGGDLPMSLIEAIWHRTHVRPLLASDVQRPVSVRDGRLYVRAVAACLNQMADALSERLDASSGNPLFVVQPDGELGSLSQASFLGFSLTQASTSAIQTLSLCMGAFQRFTQQKSDSLQSASMEPLQYAVQPPKVSQAILEGARLRFGNLPLSFTGVESGGVEDVWDLSLTTTGMLKDFIAEANSQFEPIRDLNAGSEIADGAHIHMIHQELMKLVT